MLGEAELARRWCLYGYTTGRVGTEKLFGSLSKLVNFTAEPVIPLSILACWNLRSSTTCFLAA